MKTTFLSIACMAILMACNSQNSTDSVTSEAQMVSSVSESPDSAPVFKFEKEAFDFGTITEGEKVSFDFKFTNTGNSPLIISSATATCGCTVPDYPKGPVAPGEQGVIKVVFDSSGKTGMQSKIVTITANTNPAQTQLNVLGNIVSPATAQN